MLSILLLSEFASVGRHRGVRVIALAAALFVFVGCEVQVSNSSGNENGILVNDGQSTDATNYQTYLSNNTTIGVGVFRFGDGEVVAFTNSRPVATKNSFSWTTNGIPVEVPFSNRIDISVTVWIVNGPFDEPDPFTGVSQHDRAIGMSETTTAIWKDERMGTAFRDFEIIDATNKVDRFGRSISQIYYNVNGGECNDIPAGFARDIGQTPGRINIYLVDTVDGALGKGVTCGPPNGIGMSFIAIGSRASNDLLAHELGHTFALDHVNGMADFDETNVMHNASLGRRFFTEGQTFRANLRSDSALNFLYTARPSQPTRNCGTNDANKECPKLDKRIWADGTFPPN